MTDIPTGFTPGPWKVFDNPIVIGVHPESELVADVAHCSVGFDTSRPRSETLANARLIASAPAMAEEIKRLRYECESGMAEIAAGRERAEKAEAEVERLTKRVEWFTHAVHTCHDECDRPLCKTTRERDVLRALNAELVKAGEALVDFHNGTLETKRPDVFQRLMQRLANALPPSPARAALSPAQKEVEA